MFVPNVSGNNSAQIESLYRGLATLHPDSWRLLIVAEALRDRDPLDSETPLRPLATRAAYLHRLGAEVIDRNRRSLLSSGRWPEIEASLLATVSPSMRLASDMAVQVASDRDELDLQSTVIACSGPIRSLTHALILRPFITPTEFDVLCAPFEALCPPLERVLTQLPNATSWEAPSTMRRPATFGDVVGGLLVYVVGVPIALGIPVFLALGWAADVVPIRNSTGAIAEPVLWAAFALVVALDVFVLWWVKARPRGRRVE